MYHTDFGSGQKQCGTNHKVDSFIGKDTIKGFGALTACMNKTHSLSVTHEVDLSKSYARMHDLIKPPSGPLVSLDYPLFGEPELGWSPLYSKKKREIE